MVLANVTKRPAPTPQAQVINIAQARGDGAILRAEAEAVRASGVLGRSRLLIELFDYLVEASAEGRSPKEREIGYEVFRKPGDFETGQDAAVRVYVHRLRAKLKTYPLGGRPLRLTLPAGEYRMVLAPCDAPAIASPPRPEAVRPLRRWLWAGLAAALVTVNLGAWAVFGHPNAPAAAEQHSAVWAPFAASRLPLLVVVGDYYIFGESDDGMEVNRLVREYSVNSTGELQEYLMQHPDRQGRYVDLSLSYLPTSSAAAVSRISALFAGGRKPSRVISASQLTPELLKTNDIVYVGYLSGLGLLRSTVFEGSRYTIGDSYDDIIDTKGRRTFTSQAAMGPAGGGVYRDYAYVSVFPGPEGNHIAIVAGSRDIGALAAAELATDQAGLRPLAKAAHGARGFEALYEVSGQGEVNFQSRMLGVSGRDAPPA